MLAYTLAAFALVVLPFAAFAAHEAPPAKMRAVRIHAFGGTNALALDTVPVPSPGPGELLVKVRAAGVNPVDWKIREGRFRNPSLTLPFTLGSDVAGVVESVGEGVTAFKPGDEVFAYLSLSRGGGYAEHAIVLESEAAKKPASVDFNQAAGVPLAGLTAWQALVETADIQPGQTVLIHAAAGGVGSLAVQISKAKGAMVIGTASEANHEFLRELGADQVIDYRTQAFDEIVKDADVVLDAIGGDTLARSLKVLKKGGIVVSIVDRADPAALAELGVRGTTILVRPDGEQLAELASLIDAGTIKPVTTHAIPLAEAAKAHEQSESGRTRGKIVLTTE